jgi:hypothetical protein
MPISIPALLDCNEHVVGSLVVLNDSDRYFAVRIEIEPKYFGRNTLFPVNDRGIKVLASVQTKCIDNILDEFIEIGLTGAFAGTPLTLLCIGRDTDN